MKIVFIGNFDIDYTTETHHKKTFEKLGHEVITFQENKCDINDILREATNSDMLYWTHTHGWKVGTDEQVVFLLSELKRLGIPSVGYHLDLWLGIQRQKDLETDPYWNIQYFFSVDKMMVDLMNTREDLPKSFFLRAGVFEDDCYLGTPREEYKTDVLFVGSRNYHVEWPYRPHLIRWLEETYGPRFKQYGGGGLGTIRGKDLNDLYASSKVVVGDTLCKDFNYPDYLSDRVFETTGRGGFIIHPYISGLEECFTLGEEIGSYPFNNFELLKKKIDFYIENDALREKIRLAGHGRTKKEHTYTNRIHELLTILENERHKNIQN